MAHALRILPSDICSTAQSPDFVSRAREDVRADDSKWRCIGYAAAARRCASTVQSFVITRIQSLSQRSSARSDSSVLHGVEDSRARAGATPNACKHAAERACAFRRTERPPLVLERVCV
eukprot:383996-Pleurochrysis_carterae.AAC.2